MTLELTMNQDLPKMTQKNMPYLKNHYGAKLIGLLFTWSNKNFAPIQNLIQCSFADVQLKSSSELASKALALAMSNIATLQVNLAFQAYSETWLQNATQAMFMSYFVELPDLGRAGLKLTYALFVASCNRSSDNELKFSHSRFNGIQIRQSWKSNKSTEASSLLNLMKRTKDFCARDCDSLSIN